MAGIDKTYIDGRDYPLYRQWYIDNYDKMIKELGGVIWMYPFGYFDERDIEITPAYLKKHTGDIEYYKNAYDFAIWNTSETTDKWLVKNCDIQSFRDRMLDVYPFNWSGFKGQKWVPEKNNKPKYKEMEEQISYEPSLDIEVGNRKAALEALEKAKEIESRYVTERVWLDNKTFVLKRIRRIGDD